MTHQQKKKLARLLMTPEEIKNHLSPFASEAWLRKKVNISDNIAAKENLINTKPWFNGMKTFSSVKVNPAPIEEEAPPSLGIFVIDAIDSGDGLV